MHYAYELYDVVKKELERRNCAYPLTLSKYLGIGRGETELALWCMRKYGEAELRQDGRWLFKRV